MHYLFRTQRIILGLTQVQVPFYLRTHAVPIQSQLLQKPLARSGGVNGHSKTCTVCLRQVHPHPTISIDLLNLRKAVEVVFFCVFFPDLVPAIVSGFDCFTGQSPGTRWAGRAKIQGPGMLRMLRKVEELDWAKEGLAGLPPRGGSSWGVWLQRCTWMSQEDSKWLVNVL